MKLIIYTIAHHVWAVDEEWEGIRYYIGDLFLYQGNEAKFTTSEAWEGQLDAEIMGKLYTACRYLEQHGELPEGEWTDMPPKQLPKGF
jgi:hypothetical protein